MTTRRPSPPFLLVHGAWQGGWVWHRVARRLIAAGHTVFTPTMTGLGERTHQGGPAVTLDTHIADIVGTITAEELDDFVLCGHSYGGIVVTGVADRLASRIRALVFLDAFIPQSGQAMLDFQEPSRAQAMKDQAREQGEGWRVAPRPASYFHVADAQDAAWLDRRSVPQPIGTFSQPIALTGAWEKIPSLSYIRAAGHAGGPFGPFSDRARNDARWRHFELPCGHEVMVDLPDALTGILLEIAAKAAPAEG